MKKLTMIIIAFTIVLASCSKHKEAAPKQNIQYQVFNETLKTYAPKVGTERFEYTFGIDYQQSSLNIYCQLGFLMSWESIPNGYYAYFNNGTGRILVNAKGQASAFDAGFTIDGNTANTWSADVALAYDYVLNPTLDKGELAGKGDKYIAIKIWDDEKGEDEFYYGWIKVNVSANGRNVKVIDQGIQLDQGKSLKTGEK